MRARWNSLFPLKGVFHQERVSVIQEHSAASPRLSPASPPSLPPSLRPTLPSTTKITLKSTIKKLQTETNTVWLLVGAKRVQTSSLWRWICIINVFSVVWIWSQQKPTSRIVLLILDSRLLLNNFNNSENKRGTTNSTPTRLERRNKCVFNHFISNVTIRWCR